MSNKKNEAHKELHKLKQGAAHADKGLAKEQKQEKAPVKSASNQWGSSHGSSSQAKKPEGHPSSNPHVKHSGKK